MIENKELNQLITSFKGYRDTLAPIQKNLGDFADTYETMKTSIEKLNESFAGDMKRTLEDLFKQMTTQSGKANDLSSHIEKLTNSASKYTGEVSKLVAILERVEGRLGSLVELEGRAEAQIGRLDELLAERAKSYNLKELQQSLDRYSGEVKKVAGFINNDIGSVLVDSVDSLNNMKGGVEALVKKREGESATLKQLVDSYKTTEQYLKNITENNDVNEAYMFDILDKWAESRRVKTKK